jgi:hypothetical protein
MMKLNNKLTFASLALAAGLMSFQQADAAPVSADLGTIPGEATTAGTFTDQGEVLEADFTVTSTSDVTLFTTSYAGGGFQPEIFLYTSTGSFVAGQVLTSPLAATDSTTGLAEDAFLFDASVTPGNYIAVLTDFLNQPTSTATNLSDGFTNIGAGGNNFMDEQGNARNGSYSLTLTSATVPEPASLWLSLPILGFGLAQFRKRRS